MMGNRQVFGVILYVKWIVQPQSLILQSISDLPVRVRKKYILRRYSVSSTYVRMSLSQMYVLDQQLPLIIQFIGFTLQKWNVYEYFYWSCLLTSFINMLLTQLIQSFYLFIPHIIIISCPNKQLYPQKRLSKKKQQGNRKWVGKQTVIQLFQYCYNSLIKDKMSVNHNISHEHNDKGLDQSTLALTISSISYRESEPNHQYDQEFTLNPVDAHPKRRKNCLAYEVAQTFPPRIKEEVTKIVEYYENSLENQARQYYRIVQQNHKLKKENNRLKAVNLSNELTKTIKNESKQNLSPFKKEKPLKNSSQNVSPNRSKLQLRVSDLQNLMLDKDRKINDLNSEISDLMLKLRRYKKKIEETSHN